MQRSIRAGLTLVALLAGVSGAGEALAAPSLAIAPVKDDAGGAVTAQLQAALCSARECLTGAFVGGKVDLARARRLGAGGSLVASVWKERQGKVLSAALFTGSAAAVKTWKLPLGADGRLSRAALDRLVDDVAGVLPLPVAVASPRPTPPAARPAPAPAASPPRPAPPVAAPRPAAPPAPAAPPTVVSTTPPGWEPPRPVGPQGPVPGRRAPRLAVELGLAPNHRSLSYQASPTVPVGVVADQPAMPRLRVEVRPLAERGAVLYADLAFGSGIELSSGARTHRASASRLEAGLAWRLPLSRALTLVPLLAVQRETFEVAASGGVPLADFPDLRLLGARAGTGLELWLERTRFTLLLGGAGTLWLSTPDLVGADYFASGSAWGLAVEAGLAVDVWGPLSVRVLGDYAMTRWSLSPDAGARFQSTWARQEVTGGRLMVRAAF